MRFDKVLKFDHKFNYLVAEFKTILKREHSSLPWHHSIKGKCFFGPAVALDEPADCSLNWVYDLFIELQQSRLILRSVLQNFNKKISYFLTDLLTRQQVFKMNSQPILTPHVVLSQTSILEAVTWFNTQKTHLQQCKILKHFPERYTLNTTLKSGKNKGRREKTKGRIQVRDMEKWKKKENMDRPLTATSWVEKVGSAES